MPFIMGTVWEQIAKLERRIEKLRHEAVLGVTGKLAEARSRVKELERQIAEITDISAPEPCESKKVRASDTTDYRRSNPKAEDPLPISRRLVLPASGNRGNQDQSRRDESRSQDSLHERERPPVGKVSRMISTTRKPGESINVGDIAELRVRRIEDGIVSIAFDAPKEILIYRGEIYRQIYNQKETPDDF
jgi:carbon storage regulator